ncbi:hypothetical protein J6590_088668 [Homalodisca vitripennis]|nr:hypothetical protein J6590_088668 [Homalodisca vitripennis]
MDYMMNQRSEQHGEVPFPRHRTLLNMVTVQGSNTRSELHGEVPFPRHHTLLNLVTVQGSNTKTGQLGAVPLTRDQEFPKLSPTLSAIRPR